MRKLVAAGLVTFVTLCALAPSAPAATGFKEPPTLECKGLGAKCQLSTQCCSGNCTTNWRCER